MATILLLADVGAEFIGAAENTVGYGDRLSGLEATDGEGEALDAPSNQLILLVNFELLLQQKLSLFLQVFLLLDKNVSQLLLLLSFLHLRLLDDG